MRPILSLILILVFLMVAEQADAEINPALVRIRMQKDLADFPEAKGGRLRQIGVNAWGLNGTDLQVNNKQLPHNNFIIKKANGRFDVISVLQFNDYLAGVVGNEMPQSWPLEALKAQAVVARSYALARIKERSSKIFHLDSDQNDQVFLLGRSERARAAVVETDGIVLQNHKGKVLKAYYHADCGGETVRAADVWGPYEVDSGTAKDPWCAAKKSNRWKFEIKKNDFLQASELTDLNSQRYLFSDKNQQFQLGGVQFSAQKLREIFGFFRIRSAPNTIEINEETVKFTGQGFGHGVGLCQWGTLAQVRSGISYLRVLTHYYPKAVVVRDSALKLSLNQPLNLDPITVSN